ncbi:glutathione S-transferase family protein [Leisingera methylohalidivorans]|uniref:Glutathione S-transferase n=1 Tax=Leisingera methylohalidivorans DSM 14336 TaxID=999552 RepID=V9W0C8_9RHOB|nr:glutathione S-transferase family protein [Leisingera methylohalidivorans]AHD03618.1 glutathione S-transferase [Leisingera methylohalidivorans DSM 14336]
MPTLYHAPNSRSTSILVLIEELGVADSIDVIGVTVDRQDGSGGPDPRNPHPEGKVPYLTDGNDHVRERGAIVAFLTDKFPEAGLGRPAGHPQRGAFLSWLFYYQGVMEPVLVLDWAKIDHPVLDATFRDLDAVFARLSEALDGQPYLLGEDYSAVDLLLSSPFHWLPDAMPEQPSVQAWIRRCADRPAFKAVTERERS